ncbi:MAG: FAD-binding oxidoreductase [Candidatus Edwardsbacteria bacterium]
MVAPIIPILKEIVGEENVVTGEEALEPYSHDETFGLKFFANVVVKPLNASQVSEILKLANHQKIPVTPRGAGTGVSGGALPCQGGIVLSLERMNKIKEIDLENLMVITEPGVITGELGKEVEKQGLFYPPDPASLDSCSIGGNIAECAGGPRAFKYGVTKNYVCGLEVVFPTGEISHLGGKIVKNVTGYDLISLIIGSEGTLGVVTEATLRLLPLPRCKIDLLVPFNSLTEMTKAVVKIIHQCIIPATMEFMEKKAVLACENFLQKKLPASEAEAQLFIELDGETKEELQTQYERLGEIALQFGAMDILVAEERPSQERLWEARRMLTEAITAKSPIREREDVVVPRREISDLMSELKKLEEKYGLEIISFGHLGDGNVHVNILKGEVAQEEWQERLPCLIRDLFQKVIDLGGVISGEHGIGLSKKSYLSLGLDLTQIELMKRIKQAFDPNNILNPGKIFDLSRTP